MTPPARIQAAIDILDTVLAAAREGGAAADTLVQRYFAARRYAGSKDRRAVRELVYAAIRRAGEPPRSGRAAMLAVADGDPAIAAAFDGSPHGPVPIDAAEPRATPGVAPRWLMDALAASGIDAASAAALVGRAPLDLRVNPLKADPAVIAGAWPDAVPVPGLPNAWRLPAGTLVDQHPLARDGAVEVQDAGSQAVVGAVPASPGSLVVDLCAGGGGKTLALAAAMANQGRIVAADVDRARLSRLAPRAARAGVTVAEPRLLDPGQEAAALADLAGQADAVLVDAPCSGTGTWRRNPEARWRLTPARLDRLAATQAGLLALAAGLVRPGGALVHVVCSLLDVEGADQADAFLAAHPGWTLDRPVLALGRAHRAGVRLDPFHDGADGFFVARFRAPC